MNALLTLLERTAQKAQELSASQSVAGTPLQIGDVTVIPISKVSCGFAVGGSDVPAKRKSDASLGGGGTKLTLTPLSFLAVCGTEVQMLHVAPKESSGRGWSRFSRRWYVSSRRNRKRKQAAARNSAAMLTAPAPFEDSPQSPAHWSRFPGRTGSPDPPAC